jgi:hypothetical protein
MRLTRAAAGRILPQNVPLEPARLAVPYSDADAERFARLALIDPAIIKRHPHASDAQLAQLLRVPLDQLQALFATIGARPRPCGGRRRRLSPAPCAADRAMTLKGQLDTGTAHLVAALADAWRVIAARHPDLPPAALIVGQGCGRRGGGLVLGHFAADRWQRSGDDTSAYVHVVLIGGEGLERGAVDVVATLLHEAAHAIANVRQIKDTSRQDRYHNTRYKHRAEELGLTVKRHEQIGWSLTTLPHATAETYALVIRQLEQAITLHRRSEPVRGDDAGGTNLIAATCSCPRRIRVALSVLAQGPITRRLCASDFQPDRNNPIASVPPPANKSRTMLPLTHHSGSLSNVVTMTATAPVALAI